LSKFSPSPCTFDFVVAHCPVFDTLPFTGMSITTQDLLQKQAKRVKAEQKKIRKDLLGHEKEIKTLKTQLEKLDVTAQELRAFQEQLTDKKTTKQSPKLIIKMNGKRRAEDMDKAENRRTSVSF
jgi:hypothetical protein